MAGTAAANDVDDDDVDEEKLADAASSPCPGCVLSESSLVPAPLFEVVVTPTD